MLAMTESTACKAGRKASRRLLRASVLAESARNVHNEACRTYVSALPAAAQGAPATSARRGRHTCPARLRQRRCVTAGMSQCEGAPAAWPCAGCTLARRSRCMAGPGRHVARQPCFKRCAAGLPSCDGTDASRGVRRRQLPLVVAWCTCRANLTARCIAVRPLCSSVERAVLWCRRCHTVAAPPCHLQQGCSCASCVMCALGAIMQAQTSGRKHASGCRSSGIGCARKRASLRRWVCRAVNGTTEHRLSAILLNLSAKSLGL